MQQEFEEEVEAKTIRFVAALVVFLASIVKLFEALRARRLVRPLPKGRLSGPLLELPSLSVVIPARNEERKLEGALQTVLDQNYPGLEVILIDDRSTDSTGDVMALLTAGRPDTRVIRVEELPEGWLGKNHAIGVGAERAQGDWLLFTDADVHFAPDAFRK